MKIIKIWENEANQRLDRFLRKYLKSTWISLSKIFQLIRKWNIKVNNRKKNQKYELKEWDELKFPNFIEYERNYSELNKEEKIKKIDKWEIKKYLIYEDKNWLAVNKPSWIPIHAWDKNIDNINMVDLLNSYLWKWSKTFSAMYWYRLDKDTTWVLLAWKNYESLKYINKLIKNRQTKKRYLAIVSGNIDKEIIIKKRLKKIYDKNVWKNIVIVDKNWDTAVTKVKLINTIKDKYLNSISLLDIELVTWRMHQIRVHLSSIWKPIIWDLLYWNKNINELATKKYWIRRQLLHASEYIFFDKFQNENIKIKAKIPEDFKILFK